MPVPSPTTSPSLRHNVIPVLIRQVVEQHRIYTLKLFEQVQHQRDYGLIPVLLAHLIDIREYDRQHPLDILLD